MRDNRAISPGEPDLVRTVVAGHAVTGMWGVAVAVAAVPGESAARTRPAEILRSE
jgi:hypothetical protein